MSVGTLLPLGGDSIRGSGIGGSGGGSSSSGGSGSNSSSSSASSPWRAALTTVLHALLLLNDALSALDLRTFIVSAGVLTALLNTLLLAALAPNLTLRGPADDAFLAGVATEGSGSGSLWAAGGDALLAGGGSGALAALLNEEQLRARLQTQEHGLHELMMQATRTGELNAAEAEKENQQQLLANAPVSSDGTLPSNHAPPAPAGASAAAPVAGSTVSAGSEAAERHAAWVAPASSDCDRQFGNGYEYVIPVCESDGVDEAALTARRASSFTCHFNDAIGATSCEVRNLRIDTERHHRESGRRAN